MLNLDKIVNNKNEDEDWPFRMLIIGRSGSGYFTSFNKQFTSH